MLWQFNKEKLLLVRQDKKCVHQSEIYQISLCIRLNTGDAKIKVILAFEELRAQKLIEKIIAALCGKNCFIVVCSMYFGSRDRVINSVCRL